jgi:hypothetical protein
MVKIFYILVIVEFMVFTSCALTRSADTSENYVAIANEYQGPSNWGRVQAFFQFEDYSWELHEEVHIVADRNALNQDTIIQFNGRYLSGIPVYDTCYPTSIYNEKHVIHYTVQAKSSRLKFSKQNDTIFYKNVLCRKSRNFEQPIQGIAYVLDTNVTTRSLFPIGYGVDSCAAFSSEFIKYTGEIRTIRVGKESRSAYVFKRTRNPLSTAELDLTNNGFVYVDSEWLIPVFPNRGDRKVELPIEKSIHLERGSSQKIATIMCRFDHPNLLKSSRDIKDVWNKYKVVFRE